MLGGSVVTETVFGIPGVGRLLVDAVSRADYPVIQYAILMFAIFFVVINLVTDLLTQWLDPRTREEERAGMSIAQNVAPAPASPTAPRRLRATARAGSLLRRILSQPKGAIGLTLVVLYLLLAIFGPASGAAGCLSARTSHRRFSPPLPRTGSARTSSGRDVLSRILVGARATLGIGVGGVTVAFLVGVPLGILAAWRRGWIEAAVMRAIDIMLSFPDIVFALAVVAILGANTQNVIIAVGIVSIPVFARTARAVTLSILAEPYIEGSIALGAKPAARDPAPYPAEHLRHADDALDPAVRIDPALGLGPRLPRPRHATAFPEWGTMLGESRSYIRSHPYLATFPGLFLAVSALAFNLLGDALRTIYDPTSRRVARKAPLFGFLRRRDACRGAPPVTGTGQERSSLFPFKACAWPSGPGRACSRSSAASTWRSSPAGRWRVVGESGSGKSTLLRAIGTLVNPQEVAITAGAISIGGEPALGLSPAALRDLRRRKIGIVFQDAASALNPVLTVGAQLAEAVSAGSRLDAGIRAGSAASSCCVTSISPIRSAGSTCTRISSRAA